MSRRKEEEGGGPKRPPRRSRYDGAAAHPGRDGPYSKKGSGHGREVGARHGRSFGTGICGGDRSQTDQCQTKTGAEPVTYPKQCTHHRLVASRIRISNFEFAPRIIPQRSHSQRKNRSEVSRTRANQSDEKRTGAHTIAIVGRTWLRIDCRRVTGPAQSRSDQNCAKKSLPLSSTMMKAGKSSTSIRQIASIPSSSYSSISTFLMQFLARIAAGPPIEPR